MLEIPDEFLQSLAAHIVIRGGEDPDALSVREMTEDYFEYGMGIDYHAIYVIDRDTVFERVFDLTTKALITVEFEE